MQQFIRCFYFSYTLITALGSNDDEWYMNTQAPWNHGAKRLLHALFAQPVSDKFQWISLGVRSNQNLWITRITQNFVRTSTSLTTNKHFWEQCRLHSNVCVLHTRTHAHKLVYMRTYTYNTWTFARIHVSRPYLHAHKRRYIYTSVDTTTCA